MIFKKSLFLLGFFWEVGGGGGLFVFAQLYKKFFPVFETFLPCHKQVLKQVTSTETYNYGLRR